MASQAATVGSQCEHCGVVGGNRRRRCCTVGNAHQNKQQGHAHSLVSHFLVLFELTRSRTPRKRSGQRRLSSLSRCSTARYVQGDFHAEPKIDRSWYFPFHTMLLRAVLIVMPYPWV